MKRAPREPSAEERIARAQRKQDTQSRIGKLALIVKYHKVESALIGASSVVIAATAFAVFGHLGSTSNAESVQELNIHVVPSDYGQNSALITGLTPSSTTGAERVVSEIGCDGNGEVTYTYLSGYDVPDGTSSEVNTELSQLPNPCNGDNTISNSEILMVKTIADAVGLTRYSRS